MTSPSPIQPEDVIRGVVHDLVNPLSSLSGFLNLLLDPAAKDPLTHRQSRMLVAMDRACTHVLGLLNDLSEMSLLGSPEEIFEPVPVDLRAAARRVFAEYDVLSARRHIPLVLEAPETLPSIRGDARLIERFIDALIRTAGRLAPEGGRILLRLEESPDRCFIQGTLEHGGESLSLETWERLFSASLSRPRPPEGYAALGPALCRLIARRHGGALDAGPLPGGGNAFRFRFALDRP